MAGGATEGGETEVRAGGITSIPPDVSSDCSCCDSGRDRSDGCGSDGGSGAGADDDVAEASSSVETSTWRIGIENKDNLNLYDS